MRFILTSQESLFGDPTLYELSFWDPYTRKVVKTVQLRGGHDGVELLTPGPVGDLARLSDKEREKAGPL
jgi:hypothetical protein